MGKSVRSKLLYEKNFPLAGQTRQAKSCSQPVNLPSAQPVMKLLASGELGMNALKLKIKMKLLFIIENGNNLDLHTVMIYLLYYMAVCS